jgi:hypothetical protein
MCIPPDTGLIPGIFDIHLKPPDNVTNVTYVTFLSF